MKRRHVSWICVGGRYSASRRTISAAVTSALSVRNGCDAWPGVPRTVMRHQYEPFSADDHRQARPRGVGIWKPPASVTT